MNLLVNTPVAIYNCPTRRNPIAFPNVTEFRSADASGVMRTFTPTVCVRADYSGCVGNAVPRLEDERGPGRRLQQRHLPKRRRPPKRDTIGVGNTFAFGSAHKGGFQMAYCDGSARFVDYSIDATVHSVSGNRYAE